MLKRRRFLSLSLLSGAYAMLPRQAVSREFTGFKAAKGYLMTVKGKLDLADAGVFLPHEHAFTDFTGAEKITQPQYDRDLAFGFLLPHLKALKAAGVQTLAECTPAYIGRDVRLLKKLSEASGLNILTNTGYYAAVDFKYIPAHAYTESSDQLAARWLKEWKEGIEGTGIRPGFIKLGVGGGALKPLEKKLIEAAAKTHLKSGLKIAIHTGSGETAAEEMALLESLGADPAAMIWVHAQNDGSGKFHKELAARGCWISLDGLSADPDSIAAYCKQVVALKAAGLLHKVLISQDDGFSVVKKEDKIDFEPYKKGELYTSVFTKLKPALQNAGITDIDFQQVMATNPKNAFKIETLYSKK